MLMSEEQVTTVEARKEFGRLVDAAHYSGECTVITKNGEPRAALVPYAWYRGHAGADPGADLSAEMSRTVSIGDRESST